MHAIVALLHVMPVSSFQQAFVPHSIKQHKVCSIFEYIGVSYVKNIFPYLYCSTKVHI